MKRNPLFQTAALAAAILFQSVVTSPVHAIELKENIANRIATELVMRIEVKTGPIEDMGKGADGHRINYPIIGGTFVGKHPDGSSFTGTVVPGGADFSVERNDGVTKIDAMYRLKTDDGQIIIIHNYGLWRATAQGIAKMEKGEPPIGEGDSYVRTIPSFSTQPGKYDWLEDYVYVGTLDYPAMGEVVVSIHRVDGH